MADVHKLVSKSGMISSGAAGFLKGTARRQAEDRQTQRGREKDALSTFVELTKEGWTVGDESKGISGGEGIHLEGFGILVPPKMGGTSELDIAKTFEKRQQGLLHGALARKADRYTPQGKGLVTWVDPQDKAKQVHLQPGENPPPGYVKYEVGKTPQGLITWINRNNPKEPVKRLPPGQDPGKGYVKFSEFTGSQEKLAQQKLEQSKALRADMLSYMREIGRIQVYVDMMKQKLKPGEKDPQMLINMKGTLNELKNKLSMTRKIFNDLVGAKDLPIVPKQKPEGSDEDWDGILAEALTELGFDKETLTDDELNKLRERMAIIAEDRGFKF